MGFFDFLSWNTTCPLCGNRRARKPLLGFVKCPNRECGNFDAALSGQRQEAELDEKQPPIAQQVYRNPRTGGAVTKTVREPFHPGAAGINVQYQNFQGEEKTFLGDRRTLRRRGNHLSLRLAPTGRRCAFARDRIRNLPELEQALSRVPTRREQWVMYFHNKRGSTSELYQRLRAKYPHWSPTDRVS